MIYVRTPCSGHQTESLFRKNLMQIVVLYSTNRGTWGTMKQIFFLETLKHIQYVFYTKCRKLLTFWFVDILISLQQASVKLKLAVICFIVPPWWGTIAHVGVQ